MMTRQRMINVDVESEESKNSDNDDNDDNDKEKKKDVEVRVVENTRKTKLLLCKMKN